MYRIVEISNEFYAVKLEGKTIHELSGKELDDIQVFMEEATPVVLTESIDDFEHSFAIKVKLIEV